MNVENGRGERTKVERWKTWNLLIAEEIFFKDGIFYSVYLENIHISQGITSCTNILIRKIFVSKRIYFA